MDKNTLKTIPNPIIIYDAEWKVCEANPAAIKALGFTKKEELEGKDIFSIIHPNDHKKPGTIQQQVKDNIHAQPTVTLMHYRNKPDAAVIKFLTQFTRLEDYPAPGRFSYMESAISLQETTDTIITEHPDQENLRILSDNIPGLELFLIDSSMQVHCRLGQETLKQRWHNPSTEGLKFLEYFTPELISVLHPLLKIAFNKTPISREFSRKNKFFSIRIIPLNNEREDTLCVVVLQNITESKLTENKLKLYRQQAEEANRAKDNFVAKMSHEIRTPLNAVLGFTDQLSNTRLTKKQAGYLDVVRNSSRHLLTIIDDILILSKIESGIIELDEVHFTIPDVFNEIDHLLEMKYKEKGLTFHTSVEKLADTTMLGDVAKIKQVLINLANNAIKFTKKGEISLRAILADQKQDGKKIRFEVADTGIGIKPEEIENIFKPFRQVNNLIDKNFSGCGLGLTISKDFVETMGGRLSAESTPGKGTTFSFTLTLKKGSPKTEKQKHTSVKQKNDLPKNLKILFVDDDPVNILLGKIIMRKHKISADFANSGTQALKKFIPGKYHLVFLDINMPVMSGLDVTRQIREAERNSKPFTKTTIVAMTANAVRKYLQQYLREGMDSILLKPYSEEAMIQKIIKHSTNIPIKNPDEPLRQFPDKPGKLYDLTDLLKITRHDHEFTTLMLNTFVENSENMLSKIQLSLSQNNYKEIGEVAHKLTPSLEQLGIKKAAGLFKNIETLYLYQNKTEKDPNLIITAIEELKTGIHAIRQILKETEK